MNLKDIVMTLAKQHTSIQSASFKSDIYLGEQIGLEKAITMLANLPELADEPEIWKMLENFSHGEAALA